MFRSTPQSMTAMSILSVALFLFTLTFGLKKVSSEMDEGMVTYGTNLVSSNLESQKQSLKISSIDYNNWDIAYQSIVDGDIATFYDNYAVAVESAAIFSSMYILDGFGHQSAYWDAETGDSPVFDQIDPALLANVETARRSDDIPLFSAVTFFTSTDGIVELHALAHVLPTTPAILAAIDLQDAPLALLSRPVDSDFVDKMATDLLLQGVTITPQPVPGRSHLPIPSVDGTPIAYVNWVSPQPGSRMVQNLLPLLVTLSIAFVVISMIIAVIAHRNAVTLQTREKSANQAARTDTLTGLSNRLSFSEHMDQQNGAPVGSVALIYLDLNNFKKVNDTFGHAIGDAVIAGVSQRLAALSQHRIHIARMGGDEFAILLVGCRDVLSETADVLDRLQTLLLPSLIVDQNNFDLAASVGVAANDTGPCDPLELLRRADVAMYHAKRAGLAVPQFYDAAIERVAKEDFVVERALRAALVTPDELDIAFQPIICARTGQMVKAEALARWHSATLGRVAPDHFIDIAERAGLIGPLGKILFEKTCAYLKDYPALSITVNVSPLQLQDETYLSDVNRVISSWGIDPERIDFELTEGIIVESRQLANLRLRSMKEMGFKTSLDDFGTGFSSIGYLRTMPFDTLKIDRSFLVEGETDPRNLELVKSMIIMGQSLGQVIVCEGVETMDQADLLRSFGCDLLQGYLFDRPLPIAVLADKYLPCTNREVA